MRFLPDLYHGVDVECYACITPIDTAAIILCFCVLPVKAGTEPPLDVIIAVSQLSPALSSTAPWRGWLIFMINILY